MNVVVAGARERECKGDKELVEELLESLVAKYARLCIISSSCDCGVGKYVKAFCRTRETKTQFIEISALIYDTPPMAQQARAQVYICRNATLHELGDEFHIFVDKPGTNGRRRGTIEDLVTRLEKDTGDQKRPTYIYEPKD